MNKTVLIILVIVLVVFVGSYFFLKGHNNQSVVSTTTNNQTVTPTPSQAVATTAPSATQSANTMTVEYTDAGFSPKTITIKKGEKVTWVNKTSDPLWVASNPHPVHTDYPGFDELSPMPDGGSYSFTFEKLGNWGYHNHLSPTQGGTVVVK